MRLLVEDSLKMSKRDENGIHTVIDRYCTGDYGPCFSFDCKGQHGASCEYFKKLPTGVKICTKKEQ